MAEVQGYVGPVEELPPGTVRPVGRYAVGNNGDYFAVSRRCRHLGADLAGGSIDAGCLVCPWHHATYDVQTGQMHRGPQGAFAAIPGLERAYQLLTKVFPLRRARITEHPDGLHVE